MNKINLPIAVGALAIFAICAFAGVTARGAQKIQIATSAEKPAPCQMPSCTPTPTPPTE